jgi:ADP-ribose pyrophosphatase YjhB (NUDIX family)
MPFQPPTITGKMHPAFNSYKPRHMKVFGAICVNKKGEVLLVKGRQSNLWSFPKGHCKRNERDEDCARRELKEETGLTAPERYVSYHKLRGGEYFLYAFEDETTLEKKENWEVSDVRWWPLNALPKLDSNVDVSIFRTLMKAQKDEDTLEFLDSARARRKVYAIKNSMMSCSESATLPASMECSMTQDLA